MTNGPVELEVLTGAIGRHKWVVIIQLSLLRLKRSVDTKSTSSCTFLPLIWIDYCVIVAFEGSEVSLSQPLRRLVNLFDVDCVLVLMLIREVISVEAIFRLNPIQLRE